MLKSAPFHHSNQMIRGDPMTECLGQMAGEFVEPEGAQNVSDKYRQADAHDENWCSEGQNDGKVRSYDYVEVSAFGSPPRLCEVRIYSQ